MRLRTYDITPPGGFPYEQTEGVYHKFKSQPQIEAQAAIVSNFRKANSLPRATIKEALADIDAYQCQRLGGMGQWCTDASPGMVAIGAASPIITPCKACGAPVQQ